ncbi:MAG TPA: NTP transferase domain-containing protein [Myxococcota bacterium]|nr:NTP transferase domain-containing protein [Myxococcota bacterium]HQK51615.1 NTP transferase domain-containing protein [Myxococcota bacterium]
MSRVACAILAAGAGRRAGGPKAFRILPMVPDRPAAYLTRVAEVALAGGATPVVAVVRPWDQEQAETLVPADVRLVPNPAPERGMLSSLRCAVDALQEAADGLLVFPVDHPEVRPGTVAALIEAFQCDPGSLWRPCLEGRPGHPAILPLAVARAVPSEDLAGGLAAWVRSRGLGWRDLPVPDPGILRNRNT